MAKTLFLSSTLLVPFAAALITGQDNGVSAITPNDFDPEEEGFVLLASNPETDQVLGFEHIFFPILYSVCIAFYGVLLMRYVQLNFPGNLKHALRNPDSNLFLGPKAASIVLAMLSMCFFAFCWLLAVNSFLMSLGKSVFLLSGYACLWLAYMVQAPRYFYVVSLTPTDHEVKRRAWFIYVVNVLHVCGLVAALVLGNDLCWLVYGCAALATTLCVVLRLCAAACMKKPQSNAGEPLNQNENQDSVAGSGFAEVADTPNPTQTPGQFEPSDRFDDEDFNFEIVSNCDFVAFVACVTLFGFFVFGCLTIFGVKMENDLYLSNLRNHSVVAVFFQLFLFGFIKKRKILENKTNRFFE